MRNHLKWTSDIIRFWEKGILNKNNSQTECDSVKTNQKQEWLKYQKEEKPLTDV